MEDCVRHLKENSEAKSMLPDGVYVTWPEIVPEGKVREGLEIC